MHTSARMLRRLLTCRGSLRVQATLSSQCLYNSGLIPTMANSRLDARSHLEESSSALLLRYLLRAVNHPLVRALAALGHQPCLDDVQGCGCNSRCRPSNGTCSRDAKPYELRIEGEENTLGALH